jgi:hypothetical protein
MIHY